MVKEKTEAESTSENLDLIAGLLQDIKEALNKPQSVREKVAYFSNENRSLTNKEISRILGISEKHVSKEKSLLNKPKTKEQDGREETI